MKTLFIEPLLHGPRSEVQAAGLQTADSSASHLPSSTAFLLMDVNPVVSFDDLPKEIQICLKTLETILDGHITLYGHLLKCGESQHFNPRSILNVYSDHVSMILRFA